MSETAEAAKINKWDGAAAKNAVDDAIREVMTGDLKCKESFALIDGRLFLCALAVGVALYALLWDYLYPFPQSRLVLIICVSSYFILMGILTLYTTFKEKGIFVVAKEKVGNNTRVWEASSYVKKHDDKYNLVIVMRDTNGNTREASVTKSFANFIDVNGTVVQNIVSNEITKLYHSLSSEKKEK
ncbi:signal peptidase complex subunit 2 [Bombyx mandarina]|uniref:Signal peptidase complex subunit 2 n=2 Tax=Bombyx TaxID=7090 RepID=Q2F5W0_BOMMO|nr:signal peptidase complex subunit 2 [Bombyx mori]XP_028034161.1 signal peptidase complex subunit 2 [Bombyx mandarina]ABD36257.1 signal peptidase complex subunit 2 [Bombyx mori]